MLDRTIGYSAPSPAINRGLRLGIYYGAHDTVLVDISVPVSTAAYLVSIVAWGRSAWVVLRIGLLDGTLVGESR